MQFLALGEYVRPEWPILAYSRCVKWNYHSFLNKAEVFFSRDFLGNHKTDIVVITETNYAASINEPFFLVGVFLLGSRGLIP